MTQSLLLIAATVLVTWFVMSWVRSAPLRPKWLSPEQREADRAKSVSTQVAGARDRATLAEVERNKIALAKAVKAALWVTEARLNLAVPELLKLAQLWAGRSKAAGNDWKAPDGVSDVEGFDDPKAPWASWSFDGHHWRIEAEWRPSVAPEVLEDDIGTCKVLVDRQLMLDMTISSRDPKVLWIDALTVGPWVSDLLAFAGARTSDAEARLSERSARENQERADKINWQ